MLLRQERLIIKRAGFTLMEIMVVVTIILILASAGVVVTQSMLERAKINRAHTDIKSLETAVTTYMMAHTRYPDTLQQLTQRDPFDNSPALLVERALVDPWGQFYSYDPSQVHPQTNKPRIWSNGPPNGVAIDNWTGDTAAGGH
jgi:general secretion pathway protein G